MKKKIYVEGADYSYVNNWLSYFELTKYSDAEVVLFTGGEDVNPAIYGEKSNDTTYSNPARDEREIRRFVQAVQDGKFLLGICRGSQFLTAMNGGRLIQNVSNHGGVNHRIEHKDGTCYISSTHHQMMYPFDMKKNDYELIAWASPKRSLIYENGDNVNMTLPEGFVEPEIVWYPKTNSLAIQGHPEYDWCHQSGRDFCTQIFTEKYNRFYQPQFVDDEE